MKDRFLLYIVTGPTGKKYVGITRKTLEQRWKAHLDDVRSGSKLVFHQAIRKYGEKSFTFEIAENNKTKEEISELEILYIQTLNTLSPNGYNIANGGWGVITWTKELRQKQAEIGKIVTTNRYLDSEEREKQRQIATKQWNDPEFREKMVQGRIRRFSDPEEREKSRIRFTNLWADKQFRNKMMNARYLKKVKYLIQNNTPIEKYNIKGYDVFVKREDLSAKPPLPPFSKVRGLSTHLIDLKTSGVSVVGYCETSISMAGIGIAVIGNILGMRVVIFNPIYKETPPTLAIHREQWKYWNAEIIDIKAGMAKVNYNISRNILKQMYGDKAIMLPLGLPLTSTILATESEANLLKGFPTVVVNIGSGTICSGLYRGFSEKTVVYGIMGRTGNVFKKYCKIRGEDEGIFSQRSFPDLRVIDPGYEYTQAVDVSAPFPCNKYYDAKAWLWLTENISRLIKPILFWNIGANSDGT